MVRRRLLSHCVVEHTPLVQLVIVPRSNVVQGSIHSLLFHCPTFHWILRAKLIDGPSVLLQLHLLLVFHHHLLLLQLLLSYYLLLSIFSLTVLPPLSFLLFFWFWSCLCPCVFHLRLSLPYKKSIIGSSVRLLCRWSTYLFYYWSLSLTIWRLRLFH